MIPKLPQPGYQQHGEVLELDYDSPVLSRQSLGNGISFAVSLVAHLILFLVLAALVMNSGQRGAIELAGETITGEEELSEFTTEIESESSADSLQLDATDLASMELPVQLAESSLDVDWNAISGGAEGFDMGGDEALIEVDSSQLNSGGFFGIEATGNRIVYLIDMSPSMRESMAPASLGQRPVRRYDRAVQEVLNSVSQLKPEQQFYVIMFCYGTNELDLAGFRKYCSPEEEIQQKLENRLKEIRLSPGTDPREALMIALEMKPSCCFLLSDGEFNGKRDGNGRFGRNVSATQIVRRYNKSNCPVHTIGLADRGNQQVMSAISDLTNGVYKFIPNDR